MKSVSLLTTSLLLLAATAEAVDHDERLTYAVKILGSDFAKATLYSSGEKIFGEIKTNEKWDAIFLMDNKIASRVDEQYFPTETELQLCTRNKRLLYEISFRDSMARVVKSSNGTTRKNVRRYSKKAHDLTSWIYEVRSQVGNGKSISFKVFSGNKVYDVNLTPLPAEDIATPIGVKKAIPYHIVVTRPLRFKKEIKMWFENDGSHVPLKATGRSKFGGFEVMIETIEKREGKDVHVQ